MKKVCFLLVFLALAGRVVAMNPRPLLAVGGGYLDAGPRHSGGVGQVEYRFGKYFWRCIRPQAVALFPEFRSAFFGLGVGMEIYPTCHLLFIPSFTPGLYYRGSGRNLGYPLEFRSSLEVAYEWGAGARLGVQVYHISNASLGSKNPGVNALTLVLSLPLH